MRMSSLHPTTTATDQSPPQPPTDHHHCHTHTCAQYRCNHIDHLHRRGRTSKAASMAREDHSGRASPPPPPRGCTMTSTDCDWLRSHLCQLSPEQHMSLPPRSHPLPMARCRQGMRSLALLVMMVCLHGKCCCCCIPRIDPPAFPRPMTK